MAAARPARPAPMTMRWMDILVSVELELLVDVLEESK